MMASQVQDFISTPMTRSHHALERQSTTDSKRHGHTTVAEVSDDKGEHDERAFDDRDPSLIPTSEELRTLRRVPAKMPLVAALMCFVEFAERASYFGSQGPMNNFVNNPLPKGGPGTGAVAPGPAGSNQSAGALGLGSAATTGIVRMFTFLAYVIPIWGGIVADNKWGRFKTLCVGTAVGAVAHVILVVPAIPSVIANTKASMGTFIVALIILAFAAGFIKPALGPLVCDQSPVKSPTIDTKNGERVIIDPEETVKSYLLVFYACINIGALFAIATQYSARLVGFWLAYLIPGIIYVLMPIVLVYCSPRLIKIPPQGSVLPDVWRVFKTCCSNGGWKRLGRGGDAWWDHAKPSVIAARNGGREDPAVHWDDKFVDEIRQTLSACVVFLIVPIFVLGRDGLGNSVNDMSVAMILGNVPNDLLINFNTITIIIFSPLLSYVIFPWLSRIGYPAKPMWRMCVGFLFGCVGCIFATITQYRIYRTSPCGRHATHCIVDGDSAVSSVSLWWMIPQFFFPALGELLVNVTSYELAYTRSPPRMKNFVYAIVLFNTALAAAVSMALADVIKDPNLHISWIVLACLTFVCAWIFPTYFRHLNHFEFEWAQEEKQVVSAQHANINPNPTLPKDEERY